MACTRSVSAMITFYFDPARTGMGLGCTTRGYAVLMVDGPGQGSALYDQGVVFCPDYEVVFAAILDLATERREVDLSG